MKYRDVLRSFGVVRALGLLAFSFGVAACGGGAASAPAPTSAEPASAGSSAAAQHEHDPAHHGGAHSQGYHHHRFDDAKEWSKVFDDPARDAWQKPARVVELMAISPGMRVADVGSGTGYFLPHLSRAVGPTGKVIGEDVEPDMVKWIGDRAKKDALANVDGLLGTASDPRLGEGTFDRVLIVDTWHHVDDRVAFGKKLLTALRPGGSVFVVDFTRESPQGPPPAARLLPDAVADELSKAGLSAAVVPDAGLPYQYVVRGTRSR